MDFDYFYGEQSDQYAFYRIPKLMIVEDCFQELSTNAKLLYGLLLDRVSLSASSGWLDDEGRVYIIYTIKSIQRDLHCGDKKAVRLLRELDDWGLVEKVVQGQGKPTLIYVKNFYGPKSKQRFQDSHNNDSGMVKTTILGSSKGQRNNTNITNTEFNNTYPILSETDVDKDEEERLSYHHFFQDSLEMEILKERYPYDRETLDALMEMILDVVCSKRKTFRIAGDDKPLSVVKAQFMKLDMGHVEYVLDGLKKSSSKVRNIKQYMLAALYNAPLTMNNYYQSWVNHDMATGKLYGGTDETD
jgi:hypothetical protein